MMRKLIDAIALLIVKADVKVDLDNDSLLASGKVGKRRFIVGYITDAELEAIKEAVIK
jgi:hypothetical protein